MCKSIQWNNNRVWFKPFHSSFPLESWDRLQLDGSWILWDWKHVHSSRCLLVLAHMVTLTMLGNVPMMTIGFVIYTLFRAFLYPVFIACISDKLGFKYFGILMGIGFAVSGIVQLGIAPLANAVQGTCHLQEEYVDGCIDWRMEVVAHDSNCHFPTIGHSSHLGSSCSNATAGTAHGEGSVAWRVLVLRRNMYGSMMDAVDAAVKRQSSQSTEDLGLTFSLSSSPGTSPPEIIRHGAISPSTAPGLDATCML